MILTWTRRTSSGSRDREWPTTTVSTPVPQRSVPLTTIVSMYLQPLVFSPPISLQPVVFPLITLLHVVLWCLYTLPPQILFAGFCTQDITSHLSETFRNILIQIPKFYIAWCAVLTSRDSGHDVCNHSSQPVYSHFSYHNIQYMCMVSIATRNVLCVYEKVKVVCIGDSDGIEVCQHCSQVVIWRVSPSSTCV